MDNEYKITNSNILAARKEFAFDLVKMLDGGIIKQLIAWIREDSEVFAFMLEKELKLKKSVKEEELFTPGKFIPDEYIE